MHQPSHIHTTLQVRRTRRGGSLSWIVLALLALLLCMQGTVPGFGGDAAYQATPAAGELPGGGDSTLQEESPAKLRRTAPLSASAIRRDPADTLPPVLAWLQAAIDAPIRAPAPASAPDTTIPIPPGLQQQRGQAPPRA